MSYIYEYNKLVRDKIPTRIISRGAKPKYRTLNEEEYLKKLNKKIIEEATEFIEDDSLEELADLIEVCESIMKVKNYSWDEVEEAQKNKLEKNGGFYERIFLETVEEDTINEKEEKYRK